MFLVEPQLEGNWIKYVHNNEPKPMSRIRKESEDYQRALWLCFLQHVQSQITNGLMFVSDYQGEFLYAAASYLSS